MEGLSIPADSKMLTTLVTTRLDTDQADALAERAKQADRTIAAELRRAVRFYLAAQTEEAA